MAAEGRARLRLESGPMAVRTWTALSPRAQQRALEIAPGALTWTVLLTPLIVAFAIRFNDPADLWIIGLGAVLLDAYWFLRTAVTVYWVWRSLQRLRRVEAGDWWAECERMETPAGGPGPNDITHCALIPTYTERYDVLRATVEALADQRYPDQLKVCAIITRATDIAGCDNVRRLQSELGHRFRAFIHIKDPLLPGIVVGKSAAMAYGGPVLRQHCDRLGLDPERTLVTDLDSDFRLHPQYFAHITWNFLHVDHPLTSIWQPVPVFLNNLWKVPAAVRVMATAATQWQMFLHQHPDRLVMFSSYTMSMRLLTEAGYWDSDVIPEDSAVLLEGLLPVRGGAQGAARVPAGVRRRTPVARLRLDPRQPVQPDQAVGMGGDRRPLRLRPDARPPGDPLAAARPPLPLPDVQPPHLGHAAPAAPHRRRRCRRSSTSTTASPRRRPRWGC